MSTCTTRSKWYDFIDESKHYLSGAGYNEESEAIKRALVGGRAREEVSVNNDERYLIVSNDKRCIVVKLSAFNKLNKKYRDDILSVGVNNG